MLRRRTIALAFAGLAGLACLGSLAPVAARAEAPLALRKATVGAATSWFAPDVSPEEVRWPAPPTDGMKNAPIFGYAHRWKPGQPIPNAERVQMPLYRNFDSDDPKWWDQQLDELLFTRPHLIFLIGRGCTRPEDRNSFVGPGNMCPYKLRMMVDAVRRAAAEEAARFALFVDTGATFALRRTLTREPGEPLERYVGGKIDPEILFRLGDEPDKAGNDATWYFWDATIQPWFDTIPKQYWYLINDNGKLKPVIAFWDIAHKFSERIDNTRALLSRIKSKFVARYGVEPFLIVGSSWITGDPKLAQQLDLVGGVHSWFNTRFGQPTAAEAAVHRWDGQRWEVFGRPNGLSSLTEWQDRYWGVTIPGFSCGAGCRIAPVDRAAGRNFDIVLRKNQPSALNLVEGFNGPLEDTAVYRSRATALDDPTRYLKILRRHSDPQTEITRLQAENADWISAPTSQASNQPFDHQFAVQQLSSAESGAWTLETTSDGNGFGYKGLYFAGGTYRFILRAVAANGERVVRVLVDGIKVAEATIPASPDGVPTVSAVGSVAIRTGTHDVTILINGSARLDWLTVKRDG
jgi:hypothetical protein